MNSHDETNSTCAIVFATYSCLDFGERSTESIKVFESKEDADKFISEMNVFLKDRNLFDHSGYSRFTWGSLEDPDWDDWDNDDDFPCPIISREEYQDLFKKFWDYMITFQSRKVHLRAEVIEFVRKLNVE